MADISVTAANVSPYSGAQFIDTFAGVAITAGQVVYLDATEATNKAKLADANASDAASTAVGIAVNSAPGVGQPVRIQTGGDINPGGTVAVGTIYVASATAGGIAPHGDLATGWRTNILGVGITSSKIRLFISNTTATVP